MTKAQAIIGALEQDLYTINLTLHGVGSPTRQLEDGEEKVWLTRETLELVLDDLLRYDQFRLTVDDGNLSDVTIILPALLARKQHALFFICAGALDKKGYLGREQVGVLAEEGMRVGSHGMDHKNWRTLSDAELANEIEESKNVLESITGQAVKEVSFPYGSYDRRVLRFLRNAGFDKVYTSDGGRSRSAWWIQPRNSLKATSGAEELSKISAQCDLLRNRLVRSGKMLVKRLR